MMDAKNILKLQIWIKPNTEDVKQRTSKNFEIMIFWNHREMVHTMNFNYEYLQPLKDVANKEHQWTLRIAKNNSIILNKYANTFFDIISRIFYQFQLWNICLQVIWSLF